MGSVSIFKPVNPSLRLTKYKLTNTGGIVTIGGVGKHSAGTVKNCQFVDPACPFALSSRVLAKFCRGLQLAVV